MEAQLIAPPFEPCFPVLAGPSPDRSGKTYLARGLDRYLRAAGLEDDDRRAELAAACLDDLLAHSGGEEVSWAEIIAAVDRRLTRELVPGAADRIPQSAGGRVALRLGAGSRDGAPVEGGVPRRNRRAMLPQELSMWRPAWHGEMRRLRISRSLQGAAVCLCWLAVLIIP